MRRIFFGPVFCVALAVGALAHGQPHAELSTTDINLGTILSGDVVDVPLTVRNAGDETLLIEGVKFSCHCLSSGEMTEEERTVPPGEEKPLKLRYDTKSYRGDREARIFVATNDPETPLLQATVRVHIAAPVGITPRLLHWGPQLRGSTIEETITLRPGDADAEFEVLDLSVPHSAVDFAYTTEQKGAETIVDATFNIVDGAPLGQVGSILQARVRLDGREMPVQIPLSLYVIGDAIVRPTRIAHLNRPVTPGAQISTITIVATQEHAPVRVIEVHPEGPLDAKTREVQTGQWEIDVYARDDAAPGPRAGTITAFTTSEDRPVVSVPVYFLSEGPVSAHPSGLVLFIGDAQAPAEATLRFRGEPIEIEAVSSTIDGLSAVVVDTEQANASRLIVTAEETPTTLPAVGHVKLSHAGGILDVPIVVRRTETK